MVEIICKKCFFPSCIRGVDFLHPLQYLGDFDGRVLQAVLQFLFDFCAQEDFWTVVFSRARLFGCSRATDLTADDPFHLLFAPRKWPNMHGPLQALALPAGIAHPGKVSTVDAGVYHHGRHAGPR